MREAEKPAGEHERVKALRALGILDSPPEERFDRHTRLAKRLFRVPIALFGVVDSDRQWFKSAQGLAIDETPRSVSFCSHAILDEQTLVVPDAQKDPRFVDNPLVTGEPRIRFYAGRPLHAPDGTRIATLCIIDHEPRSFGDEDLSSLDDLARMLEREIQVSQLASLDELTGIANRRAFEALARHDLARCDRERAAVSLCCFDLDGFESINDLHGHSEGDRALRSFAECLRVVTREADVVARLGGDEFAVLLPGTDAAGARRMLSRLDNALAERADVLGLAYRIRYSVGLAVDKAGSDYLLDPLLERADRALHRCKHRAAGTRERHDAAGATER